MADQDVPVSTCDDISEVAHDHDRTRQVSDFKPTNAPLSQAEVDKKKSNKLGDMEPLPEKPAP